MSTVEQLYKDFSVLADAKDKAGQHTKEFESILSAVKGTSNEKRLASQFIARFFKYFPSYSDRALDAQFDLCEDDDINIRKQAIKDLPTLCKGQPQFLPRIADVLTQLLQSEDSAELSLVQTALLQLFTIDAKGTLGGIFSQILQGEDLVRDRAIKFMLTKMPTLSDDTLTKDVEDYLVVEIKKVLQDVTGGEFMAFMQILSGLQTMQTMQGRQQLVEIITEQADLDKPFEADVPDSADRLIQCVKQAMPLFSKNVHSDRFLLFMFDQVLPVLNDVAGPEPAAEKDGESAPAPLDIQLELVKLLAELTTFCGPLSHPKLESYVETVFDKLIDYMPLPPSEGDEENTNSHEEPKLQFSYVETLIYAFHQLGRKCPQVLTDEKHAERLKDFHLRLQYFARGVQVYIKQLKMALQDKTNEDLKAEENKIKVVALRTTNNINVLIRDLFHNPPSYKATVTLSWKPLGQPAAAAGRKRLSSDNIKPITFDSDAPSKKTSKSDRAIYAPPGGKYSEKAGTYQQEGRGGFAGRRGFRRQGSGGRGGGVGGGRKRGWQQKW